LLSRRGASSWFGLALPLSVGFLLAVRMDLLEPLTLALGLMGWLAYEKRSYSLGWAFFALAGLTKEAGLVFPAAAAVWLWACGKRRMSLGVLGSVAPYLVWFLFLQARLGMSADAALASSPELLPFAGFFAIQDAISRWVTLLWAGLPAALGALAALGFAVRKRSELRQADFYLLLGQAALVAWAPRLTWVDPLAMLRVSLGLLAALILWAGRRQRRALPFLAAYYLPTSLMLFLIPGFVR
jgi:hypothetical protein